MENDYKKELEKDEKQEQAQEKNPYQAQFEAQQQQIEQLQAQLNAQNNNGNAHQSHNPFAENNVYVKNNNDPYAKNGNSGSSDVYAKKSQAQIARDVDHTHLAAAGGVVGSLAMSGQTAAFGAIVAKGAAAAGLTSVAALGSLPVAGPLLLGGGAVVLGAVGAVIAAKTVFRGISSLMGSKNNGLSMPSPQRINSIMPKPQRTIPNNQYQNIQQQGNKVDAYLKQAKKDFVDKKDVSAQVKDMSNLKGLSSKQKKEVANLYGDNQIRNSAQANGGKVNELNIKRQVLADAKEQGWNKSQTAKMYNSVKSRIEVQKDKQNITKAGKLLSVENADLKQKTAQTKTFSPLNVDQSKISHSQSTAAVSKAKASTLPKAQAKAVNNIQKQTANVGKSVVKSVNNVLSKAPQQSPAKPTQAVKSPLKSASSSKDYHDVSRGR